MSYYFQPGTKFWTDFVLKAPVPKVIESDEEWERIIRKKRVANPYTGFYSIENPGLFIPPTKKELRYEKKVEKDVGGPFQRPWHNVGRKKKSSR